jgi:hypothetical protein
MLWIQNTGESFRGVPFLKDGADPQNGMDKATMLFQEPNVDSYNAKRISTPFPSSLIDASLIDAKRLWCCRISI